MVKAFSMYLLMVLGALCVLPACWTDSKRSGFLVVNVLGTSEYDDCHIKGSMNVPFDELDSFADTLDRDSHVVFYCSNYMCTSSGYAAKMLREKGFENVWAYEGGTAEWYQMGLPVEGPCSKPYLQKKMEPTVQESDVPVISAYELARKMGIPIDQHKSAAA